MYNMNIPHEPPVIVHLRLNKTLVTTEVDTGAVVSILITKVYDDS